MNMAQAIGVSLDERSGEYRGRCSVHMDAFCWVKRDSYLPQGSQGLKVVTKYKLGYDPVEVDAEDMVALARTEPCKMVSNSVRMPWPRSISTISTCTCLCFRFVRSFRSGPKTCCEKARARSVKRS
ncbi:hypothetical protein PsorP6_018978 [Peronosclerospora sorghi]|nr:hypothetical protein PsorP6_018978 [Peronosclerospora sorghi]